MTEFGSGEWWSDSFPSNFNGHLNVILSLW
jgi:hypothetical protein